ncbi:hypothetical protein RRF57_006616 [Xylaria bambusicola]|uniref:ribonuclease T1 n=1 Tax=Xylaria bambusicola TaxID=326684 RepID=A0AAN7UQJ8_9PEZI
MRLDLLHCYTGKPSRTEGLHLLQSWQRTRLSFSEALDIRVAADRQSLKTANSYPHTYNNYEGFSFTVSGPYLEFPMLSSGVYTGGTYLHGSKPLGCGLDTYSLIGSPGADRVIINTSCKLAGAITHTGASGNNFVGCSGTH